MRVSQLSLCLRCSHHVFYSFSIYAHLCFLKFIILIHTDPIIFLKKGIFGSALARIDFDRIDYVKLVLVKIDFKLKWFIFEYINVKVS
jgi:hypothetical protein